MGMRAGKQLRHWHQPLWVPAAHMGTTAMAAGQWWWQLQLQTQTVVGKLKRANSNKGGKMWMKEQAYRSREQERANESCGMRADEQEWANESQGMRVDKWERANKSGWTGAVKRSGWVGVDEWEWANEGGRVRMKAGAMVAAATAGPLPPFLI